MLRLTKIIQRTPQVVQNEERASKSSERKYRMA